MDRLGTAPAKRTTLMGIHGNLQEVGLPDVLQLLAMGGKTGCLSIAHRSSFGSIFVERGRVVYASVVNRPNRLGRLLVGEGLLSASALREAIEHQSREPHRRLGEILIERGMVESTELDRLVRLQIEEAVHHLFTWSEGVFRFEAERTPPTGVTLVNLPAENLLLESARRMDEWSLIEQKIPSLDLVFQAVDSQTGPSPLGLTPEQQQLLPLLDGRHSLQEIVDRSGRNEFEVGKTVFQLLETAVVRAVGRKRPKEEEWNGARGVRKHRNLGVAFFEAGMWEEAAPHFRQVIALDPQNVEAHWYLGLLLLQNAEDRLAILHFQEIIDLGSFSAGAAHALAIALERSGRLEEAGRAMEEATQLAPDDPPILLSHAILLLKRGRVAQARDAFARYRRMLGGPHRPPPVFYGFALLAEAAAGDLDAALQVGEEGLAHYPACAPLLLHLGAVHGRRGKWEKAEALYRRAADADPELPQAHKARADICYRAGRLEEAAEGYRRALQLDPDIGDDAHLKLAVILDQTGSRDQAARLWRRAIELNPRNMEAQQRLQRQG